ncbi:hypothetical protein ACFQAT_06400 [Undibacterium arcticum]|uniref:Cell envelope biogenesis protein TolA n=1 Tax=Undibacterium arcticum TaxID=1762892 RepID=A0ABV7F8W9_9BURK
MNKAFAAILIIAAAMGIATVATAATAEDKLTYKAAQESAATEYKIAREKCNSFAANAKEICVTEAEAARTRTTAEAEAQYKNTPSARASASTAIANSEYDVAKTKCDNKAGNDKDVCIKEAKAANVSAKADAKADKKVVAARTDARNDKQDANYKVAIEKCDALAGASKDSCVASAKALYGK